MAKKDESSLRPKNLFITRALLKILYHKHEIIGLDRVQPNAPVVFISNHAGNYGPIVLSLYFPRLFYPWVASEMLSKNSISNYMDLNFTQKIMKLKPPISTWVTKILAFFVLRVLKDFHSIPVYRGQMRIRETINQSIRTLQQGIDLVIFPEDPERPFSKYIGGFHIGFVNLARQYFRATKRNLVFYPVYVSKISKSIRVGPGIQYVQTNPFELERTRIVQYLQTTVNNMAIETEKNLRQL